jgi:hypothetical protein
MRKLAPLFLALLALPLFAAQYGTVVIRDGDRQYADGFRDDTDLPEGGRYAYFERDGVGYMIRDEATLARLRKIVKPQEELGEQQAKVGAEQAALGAKQAALGARQAALGMQQASAGSSARQRELGAQQHALAEQQRELARQQEPFAEQQRILGQKQREAGRVARRQFEKVFDEAIRSGVAKRR